MKIIIHPTFISNPQEEEEDARGEDDETVSQLLTIPRHCRRLSSITVSSGDSSYLERRGSALEMGLPVLPSGTPGGPAARGRAPPDVKKSLEWDFYYPIDIRVSWSSIYFISKLYRENENLKDQTQDLFIP